MLNIEENRSTTRYNDISTVYAWLVEPVPVNDIYTKKTDVFSCFSDHYRVGQERDFIKDLDEKNPGKYTRYVIAWSDSN